MSVFAEEPVCLWCLCLWLVECVCMNLKKGVRCEYCNWIGARGDDDCFPS